MITATLALWAVGFVAVSGVPWWKPTPGDVAYAMTVPLWLPVAALFLCAMLVMEARR